MGDRVSERERGRQRAKQSEEERVCVRERERETLHKYGLLFSRELNA